MNQNKYSAEAFEIVQNFILLHDDFMKIVFADKECTELMLRIIIEKPDLHVLEVKTEYTVNNLYGRGVRLDVRAEDTAGVIYDIEVQRNDKGAISTRARYNSSLMDADVTEPGDSLENLAETYVIFITENDVLKKGLPIYHIERVILETGELFNDKAHIIYVNSEIINDTALGKLMHDFRCRNADNMNYSVLSDKVRALKETDEGVDSMCKAVEDYGLRCQAEGRAEGRAEGTLNSLRNLMINADKSLSEAMELLGIPKSDYEKYAAMINN